MYNHDTCRRIRASVLASPSFRLPAGCWLRAGVWCFEEVRPLRMEVIRCIVASGHAAGGGGPLAQATLTALTGLIDVCVV